MEVASGAAESWRWAADKRWDPFLDLALDEQRQYNNHGFQGLQCLGDKGMYNAFSELDKITPRDYENAFLAIRKKLSKNQYRMLEYHYHAVNYTVAPSELASLIGFRSIDQINLQYGKVGTQLCKQFGLWYEVKLSTLVYFEDRLSPPDQYLWIMRENAVTALSSIGWFGPSKNASLKKETSATLQDINDQEQSDVSEEDTNQEIEVLESLKAIDLTEPTERVLSETYRILRDTTLSKQLKKLHGYKCQLCHTSIQLGNNRWYVEAHHIKPLGTPHNGPDIPENIICVCPNHHVQLDYGAIVLNHQSISTVLGHNISQEFTDYHNTKIYNKL